MNASCPPGPAAPHRPRLTRGADGWRGQIGRGFTPAAAAAVSAAAAQALAARGVRSILVGYDGRELSEASARAAAAAAARYAAVTVAPHLPTPTATFAVRRRRYDAALLVTASHNPAGWNGVKVRTFPGIPPDRALEDEIDRAVASGAVAAGQPAATLDAAALDGLVSEHHDHALRCFPELGSPPVSAPRVVVDGVHGIAGQALARLCQRLGWRVLALGTDPRPDFGGLVPDPTRARTRARAAAAVTAAGADFGLVLDGDGDRLWLVDDQGRTVQPHHLFALLLQQEGMWAQDTATARAPVAVTVSCGSVVAQVCSAQGRRVLERAIGFKHVAPLLASGEVGAGAGSVGDLAFARFSADRDPAFAVAMLAALLRRAAPARLRGLVSALIQRYGATSWEERYLPGVDQDEASLHRQAEAALAAEGLLAGVREVTRVDGVKFWLGDGQWLLLRPASTEPGIRVFSEMRDPGAQQRLLGRLCEALYAT